MKIAIIGMGYVGATTAAVLASWGHQIFIYDKDLGKLSRYLDGCPDVKEFGLVELISEFRTSINILSHISEAVNCDLAFVCVNTPVTNKGLNLLNVISVLNELRDAGAGVTSSLEIAIRSTVTPDFIKIVDSLPQGLKTRIFLNPEFLREGVAIKDFNNPPKIVVGSMNGPSQKLDQIYSHLTCEKFLLPMLSVTITKLIDNSWHALKVAFGNEVGSILKALGLDAEQTLKPFFADTKLNISSHYLHPGSPFGGSCLTKDLSGLQRLAEQLLVPNTLLKGVSESNDNYIIHIVEDILKLANRFNKSNVLIYRISFKAGTNDMRESPNLKIGKSLSLNGLKVNYIDPDISISDLTSEHLTTARQLDKDFSLKFRNISDYDKKIDILVVERNDLSWRGILAPELIFYI